MQLLLKSLVLFLGLAAASPALAFSYSCADWKVPDLRLDFWKEATRAIIADCVQDMGFAMGFSVKDRDDGGLTPLHWAARKTPDPDVITFLLEAGADVNARDGLGSTPLHWAAALSSNPDVITTLIKAGADVNARDGSGRMPLHDAGENSNPDIIIALIRAGADVNARSKRGNTPLHAAAAENSNPDVITALLEAGADGSLMNEYGSTPFESGRNNRAIHNSEAYWALNDALYK